jgi:hypothetical protein
MLEHNRSAVIFFDCPAIHVTSNIKTSHCTLYVIFRIDFENVRRYLLLKWEYFSCALLCNSLWKLKS